MGLRERLERLGLTGGESKVYLALLQHGSSTVGPIVKTSGIAYSNIYEVLERLQEKGLASFIIKSKTKHYSAVHPDRVKGFLEKKQENLDSQRALLEEMLPELRALHGGGGAAEAEIFLGWKGVRSAFHRMVEDAEGEHCFFYVDEPEMRETVDAFFEKNMGLFRDKGVRLRGVSHESYRESELLQRTSGIDVRFVDFPVPGNIDICNGKILIEDWKIPLAVLITNEEIADNFRRYFETVWVQASE